MRASFPLLTRNFKRTLATISNTFKTADGAAAKELHAKYFERPIFFFENSIAICLRQPNDNHHLRVLHG